MARRTFGLSVVRASQLDSASAAGLSALAWTHNLIGLVAVAAVGGVVVADHR